MKQDPIDDYLDELFARLRGKTPQVRRFLHETEHHLREAAADGELRGLDGTQAQHDAIERFGTPGLIAKHASRSTSWISRLAIVQLAQSLALLATLGLTSIAVSGALAAGLGAIFGKSFISGDGPGVIYTATRCADFKRFHPEETSCSGAAVAHHFDEVVGYRLDAGVLAVAALIAFIVIRRYNRHRHGDVWILPEGFTQSVGAALFGFAAVTQMGLGLMSLVGALLAKEGYENAFSQGAGSLLSGGIVATAAFAGFALAFLRALRTRSAPMATTLTQQ